MKIHPRELKTMRLELPPGMSRTTGVWLLLNEVALVACVLLAPFISLSHPSHTASVPELICQLHPETTATHAPGTFELYLHRVAPVASQSFTISARTRNAIIALRQYGTNAAPAVPHLIPFLADSNDELAFQAADALSSIGGPPEPHLLTMLRHPNPHARELAVFTLMRLRPSDAQTVKVLVPALQDENNYVRLLAAQTLSETGQTGTPAIPALRSLLTDTNQSARCWSAVALWRIGHESHLPQLIEGAKIPRTYVSVEVWPRPINETQHSAYVTDWLTFHSQCSTPAIDAIAENVSTQEQARQALMELGKSEDWNVRNYAIRQIWKRGHDPELAATMLMHVIRRELTPNPIASDSLQLSPAPIEPNWVVNSCLDSLAVIGPGAKAALPILKQLAPTSGNALEALKKIAPDEATRLIDKLKQEGKPVPPERVIYVDYYTRDGTSMAASSRD